MKGSSSMAKKYKKAGRPVNHPKVICVETGEVFDTYSSAARKIFGDRRNVCRCCQGTQKDHKGYHFRYFCK